MDPLAIIEKLQVELNELIFELSGKLPAPQVQVDSLPQFYYNEPYNQSYQQVVNQYSIAPLIQAPSFYEQSPPSYTNGAAPLPNSFAPFTPNSMTAPAPADLHRQFPRLTTPRTQSLDHLASDSQVQALFDKINISHFGIPRTVPTSLHLQRHLPALVEIILN